MVTNFRIAGEFILAKQWRRMSNPSKDLALRWPRPLSQEERQAVEEFVQLDLWRRSIERDIKRHEDLKDRLKGWFAHLPAEGEFEIEGNGFVVQVGANSKEKTWTSLRAVMKACGGVSQFLTVCTVTFKAVSELIGEKAARALQVEEQTGSRRLKVVLKAAQQKAA